MRPPNQSERILFEIKRQSRTTLELAGWFRITPSHFRTQTTILLRQHLLKKVDGYWRLSAIGEQKTRQLIESRELPLRQKLHEIECCLVNSGNILIEPVEEGVVLVWEDTGYQIWPFPDQAAARRWLRSVGREP